MIDSSRTKYWKRPLNGWDAIVTKLPQQVVDDASEASKCYACGRNTAAVMHLCRVLECGFKDFATRHGITFKHGIDGSSWEAIAENIKLHRDTNKSTLAPAEITVLNTVRDQIVVLKGMWRNPTMHSTGTFYTEEQVLNIYHAVQSLMRELVSL